MIEPNGRTGLHDKAAVEGYSDGSQNVDLISDFVAVVYADGYLSGIRE